MENLSLSTAAAIKLGTKPSTPPRPKTFSTFLHATRNSAQPGMFWRTQAARWSRFLEGVLASLKLKLELYPIVECTALRATESKLYKLHDICHQLCSRRATLTKALSLLQVNPSRKHGHTKPSALRACPCPFFLSRAWPFMRGARKPAAGHSTHFSPPR
jgi:hypothetical protein